MKKVKKQKGITLIALIVTVIVLAITTAVVLNVVAGSNGIIAKASKAVDANEKAQIKEDIELTLAEMKTDYYISEDRTTYGNFENYWKAQLPITTKRGGRLIKEIGLDGEESLITYITKKGIQYDISTSENIVSGPLTGSEDDDIPPTIGTPVVGATTASVTLIDARGSGVASYIVKEENIAPTEDDEGWIDLPEVSKSYRLNLTGLQVNKTYYIFAKDAQGNISEATSVTTKEVDAATSLNLTVTNTTWENANATVTFNTSTEYKIQLSIDGTNWNDSAIPNSITVPSGTAIYARLTDDFGNSGTNYIAHTPCKQGSVSYDANGGTGEVPDEQTANHTQTVNVSFSTLPTKTNYQFMGWSTSSSATTPTYTSSGTNTFTMGIADVILYAVWDINKYTISYNANGGTGSTADQTKIHGNAINLSANGFTAPTGKQFKEWNTSADGSGTKYAAGASYTENSDLNLYAIWDDITYTISYNANGGTGSTASQTKTHGTAINLRSNGFTAPTSCEFLSWNTAANGTGTTYTAGQSYTDNAGLELYAQWLDKSVKTNIGYTKYYADIEGDGIVDGIIYADLLAEAGTSGSGFSFSYTIPSTVTSSNVKSYEKNGSYTDSHFGTHEIIKPVSGTTGEDRFFVMKLTDSGSGTWSGGSGTAFGTGKSNCGVSGSGQWFRPSKGEWAKFINLFGITSRNYSNTYGLASSYWSSSQAGSDRGCFVTFSGGYFYGLDRSYSYTLRLSATF